MSQRAIVMASLALENMRMQKQITMGFFKNNKPS